MIRNISTEVWNELIEQKATAVLVRERLAKESRRDLTQTEMIAHMREYRNKQLEKLGWKAFIGVIAGLIGAAMIPGIGQVLAVGGIIYALGNGGEAMLLEMLHDRDKEAIREDYRKRPYGSVKF